jgi:hypothetical protein
VAVGTSEQLDRTTPVLQELRAAYGERFVPARVEAEREAVGLLNARAGEFSREEANRLGQLFNRHEKAGRVRHDRFLPAFAGATMAKQTEDLERFNQVVADLWTAPIDVALTTLGQMYADRSVLPGAGSSLPSVLLYLRDPERFAVCINATTNGLSYALDTPRFRADSRASYEAFCTAMGAWRRSYGVAPQEADAVLADIWRAGRQDRPADPAPFVFGTVPMRFLADLAAHK